jgi:hypothetical protein
MMAQSATQKKFYDLGIRLGSEILRGIKSVAGGGGNEESNKKQESYKQEARNRADD